MLAQLASAGIEYSFVSAIDDRALDLSESGTVAPSYLMRSDWRPGRIGNGLSHLRAYEQILSDGLDQALVLEDDVILPRDLGSLLDAVGPHLTGAEVALLHFDSHAVCELSTDGAVSLPGRRTLALPIDISVPVGGAAYVITREACARMTDVVLPVRAHSDDWLYWYNAGALDRIRCAYPHIVTKDPGFESTIDYAAPTSFKARTRRLVASAPIFGALISYRRKNIWRKWTRIELVDKPFIKMPSRLE
jgi:GR25 family glycosyltransferase involved in LPS biosynthesis